MDERNWRAHIQIWRSRHKILWEKEKKKKRLSRHKIPLTSYAILRPHLRGVLENNINQILRPHLTAFAIG
jgi:hypothetical protein